MSYTKVNNQGYTIIVDDEDAHFLNQNYHISKCRLVRLRRTKEKPGPREVSLKSEVLNLKNAPYCNISHVNGNIFDCRKENLYVIRALSTPSQKKHRLGFYYHKYSKKWCAKINGQYLGLFATWYEAATAYRKAEKELYGSLARPDDVWYELMSNFEKSLYEEL